MGFADRYISNNLFLEPFINTMVDSEVAVIVTVPVYNEPNVLECLNRLSSCNSFGGKAEVIIVINSSETVSDEIRNINRKTYSDIVNWIESVNNEFISFYVHIVEDLPVKHAGVGLARKIAMDQAVVRFNEANNPNGIIVGFDADTLCEPNYFSSIVEYFSDNKIRGASIYFEHPLSGNDCTADMYKASAYYELYLRYYNNCLRFIGHPHAFYCIGSAYAVRAKVYVSEGGMNRKQAGEDFYFIQKIVANGGYGEILSTVVSPSSRFSDRTPFGTGRSIFEMCKSDSIEFYTYSFESFLPLIDLFDRFEMFYNCDNVESVMSDFSPILRKYLIDIDFVNGVKLINSNCSSINVFRMKFYKFMSIFKVLKYLNYSSDIYYPKESVIIGALKLLEALNIKCNSTDVFSLLQQFRCIDRESNYRF